MTSLFLSCVRDHEGPVSSLLQFTVGSGCVLQHDFDHVFPLKFVVYCSRSMCAIDLLLAWVSHSVD